MIKIKQLYFGWLPLVAKFWLDFNPNVEENYDFANVIKPWMRKCKKSTSLLATQT